MSLLSLAPEQSESLLRLIEASVQVSRRYQFYLWTQGDLQRLMQHKLSSCGAYDIGMRELAFDVLNTRNKWIYKGCALLNAVTDPVVRQVRRFIPPLGGVDITPMVIIFGIYILQALLLGLR